MSDKAIVVSNPLAPASFTEAKAFAELMAKSDFVPTGYRNKPGDILAAIQMGAEVGLAPMAALQNIAVINGKPTIWGDAVPGIAMTHRDFEGMDETFDEKSMTATCRVRRKGSPEQVRTFSQKDAEIAGLWGKNTWKQYPKRMLQMRARGFAMRDVFPDALKGLITREEAEDYPAIKEINPKQPEPTPADPGHSPRQQAPIGASSAPAPASPLPPATVANPGTEQAKEANPKPMPPADPEEGEKGILPKDWIAATDAMYHAANPAELKAACQAVWVKHENEATERQMGILEMYKEALKPFVKGK